MGGFVDRIKLLALGLGAPGLFLVAFLDSSFLSLPEIADILVVWAVTQHKSRMLVYVLATTLGSIAGCLVMYYLGRKGGDAVIRKRFGGGSVDRTLQSFKRWGVMAVLIPSILPPPAPFKIFVLVAGLADITVGKFIAAVAIGRGARYLAEGLLAVYYGDAALAFIDAHGRAVSLWIVAVLGLGILAYVLWRKVRARMGR